MYSTMSVGPVMRYIYIYIYKVYLEIVYTVMGADIQCTADRGIIVGEMEANRVPGQESPNRSTWWGHT